MCEHNWVFQSEHDFYKERGVYTYTFKRVATYYCNKCLENKNVTIKKEDTCGNIPTWYTGSRI